MEDNIDFSKKYSNVVAKWRRFNLSAKIQADKALSKCELYRGQLPLIEYIIDHDGCNQCDIAQSLGVSPASIACSTKRMQDSGLLEKAVDDENLRCKKLTVTEKGLELAKIGREAIDELDGKIFEGFTSEELLYAEKLLDKVISNINKIASEEDRKKI